MTELNTNYDNFRDEVEKKEEERSNIQFDFEGKHYTLEFNRKTASYLQSTGFQPLDVFEKSASAVPLFFHTAFGVHHKGIKRKFTNKIWEKIVDKTEFLEALLELYSNPLNVLFEDPDENDEGKIIWS